MGKRKRGANLWLSRPKKRQAAFSTPRKNAGISRPRTPSTRKYVYSSPGAATSPCKTPASKKTPGRTGKHQRTPFSSKKSKKRLVLEEQPEECDAEEGTLAFDDVPEGAKDFIDVASDINVLKNLSNAGVLIYFIQFFTLVKENKYPIKNIAFLLWIETVRWYHSATAQSMWYFEETKRFWRAGYRLFHGKFLSFMSGPKCLGKLLSKNQHFGRVIPQESEINFAVPNRSSIVHNDETPSIIQPGLLPNVLSTIKSSSHTDVFMMCVDGKRVTPGLDKSFGDVDMFGFENKPTIHECRARCDAEKTHVDQTKEFVKEIDRNVTDANIQKSLLEKLRAVLLNLTLRIKEARDIKAKQEYGLEKLKERAGPEWKSSKYLYAISGIQAFLYRLRQYVDGSLDNILKIVRIGSEVSCGYKLFALSRDVNPVNQENMKVLKPVEEQTHPTPMQFIKQRSEEWGHIRGSALVTGSTFHSAIGLRSLKEQKSHFEKVIHKQQSEPSATTQMYMDHGTKNEPNAVATLVGRFMPMFFPKLAYIEEGCYMIPSDSKDHFLEVSPDGSLRNCSENIEDEKCVAGVEIKCPYPKDKTSSVHYSVPPYYVCQCLSEMKALNTDSLIYVCYTEASTTFFNLEFDTDLWDLIVQEAEDLYDVQTPQRPSRLSPNIKRLKDALEIYVKEKVQLIVEIPSVQLQSVDFKEDKSNDSPFYNSNSEERQQRETSDILDDLIVALHEASDLIETGFQLTRKKASEVMVWVLSNKDRMWSSEIPNSVPIAYGMKDYKFSAQALRDSCNSVLRECKKNDLHVPLLAFDGQWYSVMVRDENGKPLTVLQLQKDVWNEVSKMKKKELTEILKDLNKPEGLTESKVDGKIVVESNNSAFRCFRYKESVKHRPKRQKESACTEEADVSSLTWLPENVLRQIEERGDTELLTTLISVNKEIEANSSQQNSVAENDNDNDGPIVDVQVESDNVESVELSDDHFDELSEKMKEHKPSSKWTSELLKIGTETAESIKRFTVYELDIIADFVKKLQPITYKKSWQKCEKVNAICRVLGDHSTLQKQQRTVRGEVPSLQKLSLKILNSNKVKKAPLATSYASYIFPDRLEKWREDSPVPKTIQIGDNVHDMNWYSVPEANEATGELLCKCLDSHHLLTNLRIKTSTTGVKNVSSEAWKKVAHSYKTNLTPAMVDDLVDKQSNAFAQTHFSAQVESAMIENGDVAEAGFCKLIREWYEAEDSPALNVEQRVARWLSLKHYLLDNVDFSVFPPRTQFINGFSAIAFEGFLVGVDTKLQLYHLCKGSYCVRTATSLPAETCVGGIQDLNINNHVAVKAKDVPKIMASLTEIMTYKCNPERGFHMKTSRAAVYPIVEGRTQQQSLDSTDSEPQILPRNHPFDDESRRRLKPHRKSGTVNRNLDSAPRGTQPMRREFFKCDESKIDPLKRSGFKVD